VALLVVPELDQNGGSDDLDGGGDNSLEPVLPAHGETHGRVNVTSGELDEARGRRVIAHHLSERVHHGTDKETDNEITDDGTDGATVGKGLSCITDEYQWAVHIRLIKMRD
jgi:hypothetical protein